MFHGALQLAGLTPQGENVWGCQGRGGGAAKGGPGPEGLSSHSVVQPADLPLHGGRVWQLEKAKTHALDIS